MLNADPVQFSAFVAEVSKYTPGIHILNAGATREQVLAVEKELAINLPERYRQFLLQYNGGSLFHDAVVLFATHKSDESCQKETLTTINKLKWLGMPAACFTIVAYSYGDEICLVLDEHTSGLVKVILWDHEIGKVVRRWPSLEAWLDYEMRFGSTMYNLDGTWKVNRLEKAVSILRRLLDAFRKRALESYLRGGLDSSARDQCIPGTRDRHGERDGYE
jgi:hypothetical protein